jgi:hypothetical protein
MTPQEKAKELFHKFYLVNAESVELETGEHELLFSLSQDDAKKCALIMVEAIIERSDTNKIVFGFYEGDCLNQYTEDFYWRKVKQELEKL